MLINNGSQIPDIEGEDGCFMMESQRGSSNTKITHNKRNAESIMIKTYIINI